jgi:hypothetical protein
MADDPSVWEQWQALLSAENPDLLKILKLGAQLQAYFATVERETLKVARATGVTWAQLGEALGTSRQAVWQRVTSSPAMTRKPRSGPPSFLDEDHYEKFRRVMEDIAARRDQVAGEMFDVPRGSRVTRKHPYPKLPDDRRATGHP